MKDFIRKKLKSKKFMRDLTRKSRMNYMTEFKVTSENGDTTLVVTLTTKSPLLGKDKKRFDVGIGILEGIVDPSTIISSTGENP